jgi:beta-galactosidase
MVYIAHYWQKPLKPNNVWIASNCERVELFVNGRSRGTRSPERYRSLRHPLFVWKAVPFRTGELKAVGYIGNAVAAVALRKTPGTAVELRILPDDTLLTTGGDMTRVAVVAIDSSGQAVRRMNDPVTLSVSGAGDFLGESPVLLENGKTAFFVKTRAEQTGAVICRARCRNMAGATARIAVIRD